MKGAWVKVISKSHRNKVSRSEVQKQNDKTPSLSVVEANIVFIMPNYFYTGQRRAMHQSVVDKSIGAISPSTLASKNVPLMKLRAGGF